MEKPDLPRLLRLRLVALACMLLIIPFLAACGGDGTLYITDLLEKAPEHNGKEVTVDGAFLQRDGRSLLAVGVSTLDNGLDAQPLGEPIWLDGFPSEATRSLHQPGDAIYGFVRVTGRFETGDSYGPDRSFKHRIEVARANPLEQVRRNEVRTPQGPIGEGKLSFYDLVGDPARYNGQTVTTRGYYFWNSVIFVLAEGISTEEDGSSPQPIGHMIWMEGFPPDESGKLNLGPNNSYVWGSVEVTGTFQSGGNFGKDGAFTEFLQVTSAKALEQR